MRYINSTIDIDIYIDIVQLRLVTDGRTDRHAFMTDSRWQYIPR